MNKGAKFSECGKYRYQLWRIWDESKPLVQLIGLNPSTANADKDDATIRRITSLCASGGFGGFYMTNIFGLISADPKALTNHPDPMGDNWEYIIAKRSGVIAVCFCWGSFKEATGHSAKIISHFPEAMCFGINKDGAPKHPLYLKAKTHFVNFR